MRLWDLSPPLAPDLAVWPGDTPFACERTWTLGPGCPVNVSRLTLSTHTGAHADAPLHYASEGADAAGVALAPYLGPCVVLDVRGGTGPIRAAEVRAGLRADSPRVLLRTFEVAPRAPFPASFRPVSAEAIDALAAAGVVLIGVDTPSLDPTESKTLDAHHAVRRGGLAILEGLVLDEVPPGRYELIALPLRILNADASPVRAVLRELTE